jgi:N-acetylneuraminic acid mutarotase
LRPLRTILIIIACYLLSSPLIAVKGNESDRPSPRFGHRMVYDPVNERILLFGGVLWEDRYTFYDDLWSYDYSTDTWTEFEDVSGPMGRFNFMMIYLSVHHQLFLFGGFSAADRISDTWIYDITDNRWTQLRTDNSPSPRSDGALVYDPVNDVVILHDGYCANDSHRQDTWVFDFESIEWTLMDPEESPLPQYGHHMIYDTENRMLVMYGGHWSIQGTRTHGYSDGVWAYDYPTDTWTKIDEASTPPARYWHNLAYDEDSGKMVVFGGSMVGDSTGDDTWLFDASTNSWEEIESDETPPKRMNSAMAYDQAHGMIIMFGGLGEWGEPPLDDLWFLDPDEGGWREVSSEPISLEEEDTEPDQTGIPGFPLLAILLGLTLIALFLRDWIHTRTIPANPSSKTVAIQ